MSAFDDPPAAPASGFNRAASMEPEGQGESGDSSSLPMCALPNGIGAPKKCVISPCSPDPSLCASPLGASDGGQRMSKMNRLKMQMCLSIGDASSFQTHHTDEAHMSPIDAAACETLTKITDYMFLGSWRDSAESAVPQLKANGITHILNLAREHAAEGEPDRHPDLVFTTIPMNDDHQEDLYERLLESHEFIEAAKAAGGKVLVHCRRGISRSPAIVVSYLMRYRAMTYDEAYKFVSDRRRVSLNLAFRMFLSSWDPAMGRPPTSARAPIHT